MIATYTPFYQEIGPHLERHLKAEQEAGVRLGIYVDGPFPLFDYGGKVVSDDGSRELIKSYQHTVILDAGINYMPIKTNLALHEVMKRNFKSLLITGADEWIIGNIQEINVPDTPMANIWLQELNPNDEYNKFSTLKTRLVCWADFVRSRDIHWYFFCLDKMIISSNPKNECPTVQGITIYHDSRARPKTRDLLMAEYQKKNVIREERIIEEYKKSGLKMWYE